jgi:hypothetical protein
MPHFDPFCSSQVGNSNAPGANASHREHQLLTKHVDKPPDLRDPKSLRKSPFTGKMILKWAISQSKVLNYRSVSN